MADTIKMEVINSIIEGYKGKEEQLIGLLQDVQSECNYLPRQALVAISEKLGIPLSQVYGVATFFRAFSLKPQGRHRVTVCLGTACHVRGGLRLLEKLERDLKLKSGDTTEDLKFTLNSVNCLGACALGPLVVLDGKYQGQMNSDKLDKVMKPLMKP